MSDAKGPVARSSLSPTARAAGLAGVHVHGADGDLVGRVRDIYLHDRSGSLRAITVTRGRWSTRTVLIPVAALRGGADAASSGYDPDGKPVAPVAHPPHRDHTDPLTLLVDAQVAREGVAPPATGHVTPQQLHEAAEALGLNPARGSESGDA